MSFDVFLTPINGDYLEIPSTGGACDALCIELTLRIESAIEGLNSRKKYQISLMISYSVSGANG